MQKDLLLNLNLLILIIYYHIIIIILCKFQVCLQQIVWKHKILMLQIIQY